MRTPLSRAALAVALMALAATPTAAPQLTTIMIVIATVIVTGRCVSRRSTRR